MVISKVGNILLKLHNQKHESNLTPREYFMNYIYPLQYEGEKQLVHNNWCKLCIDKFSKENERLLAAEKKLGGTLRTFQFKLFLQDLERCKLNPIEIHGGLLIGGKAGGMHGTTSGLVTNISYRKKLDENEVFNSFIGRGLSVRIEKGDTIFFTDKEIIEVLNKGWYVYAQLLKDTPTLKGNQLETWNGIFLTWFLSKKISINELDVESIFVPEIIEMYINKDSSALKTVEWLRLFANLAVFKQVDKPIMVFAQTLANENRTRGLTQIELKPINKLIKYARLMYGNRGEEPLKLYETAFKDFYDALQKNSLGIDSLKPADLNKLAADAKVNRTGKQKRETKKDLKDRANKIILLQNSVLWIITYFDDMKLRELADSIAQVLIEYQKRDRNARTVRKNKVIKLLDGKNKEAIVEALTSIIQDEPTNVELREACSQYVDYVLDTEVKDVYLLFMLIKFSYELALTLPEEQAQS